MTGDVPILAGEQWFVPQTSSFGAVHNPSRGEEIARVPMCGAAEVEVAVQAASIAFGTWSKTPAPARAAKMFAFKAMLEAHFEELAALITREKARRSTKLAATCGVGLNSSISPAGSRTSAKGKRCRKSRTGSTA